MVYEASRASKGIAIVRCVAPDARVNIANCGDPAGLWVARVYEAKNANRATILAAIDRRRSELSGTFAC